VKHLQALAPRTQQGAHKRRLDAYASAVHSRRRVGLLRDGTLNRIRRLPVVSCAVLATVALSACGSNTIALSTTTSSTAHTTTDLPVHPTSAPCTAPALQAALPIGTTIVTTDLAFRCVGRYAGAEINEANPGGGAASGYTTDTLFRMEGSTWVDIGRSLGTCRIVPPQVHVYCTVD
jgi:hypothetical protein